MSSKFCIAFYGIGRNTELCREISFYRRVFDKPYFVYFLHREELIDNPRSKEVGALDYNFIRDLGIPIVPVELDLGDSIYNIINCSVDPHNDGRKSLTNLLKQLLVLKQMPNYLNRFDKSDNFFIIRDDVKFSFFSKLLLRIFPPIPKYNSEIYVSGFSWHGGVNDKFFISSKHVMLITCSRIAQMFEFIEDKGYLNAEHLLRYTITLHDLKVVPVFLNVGRVRMDGTVIWDKFLPAVTRPKDIYRVFIRIVSIFWKK
jgi:hypothetical protein